jgi:glycosyltransferase involved in cell wall biosynthesis
MPAKPTVIFVAAVGTTLHHFVAPVAGAISASGYRTVGVAGEGSIPKEMVDSFDRTYVVHPFRRGSLRSIVRAGIDLGKVVRGERPKLLHLHSPYGIALGRMVARASRVPHVAIVHGTLFGNPTREGRLFSAAEFAVARATRNYVALNRSDQNTYQRLAPRSHVELAPCGGAGINVERLRGDAAASGQRRGRPPRVLAMGRLTQDKNLDLTVAAWRIARNIIPDLELRIVGSPAPNEPVWDPPSDVGISRSAWTDRPGAELAESDVLVSTSLREGFPMVLAESLIVGTPVVAVRNRGSQMIAEHVKDGLTLAPPVATAVAQHIITQLRAPGFSIPASISAAWSRDAVVEFHTRHIESLLQGSTQ